jgi:hypothetical protein
MRVKAVDRKTRGHSEREWGVMVEGEREGEGEGEGEGDVLSLKEEDDVSSSSVMSGVRHISLCVRFFCFLTK